MRSEKSSISKEYLERLNQSPFFIVIDYTGLKVGPFTELRKRLFDAQAEVHVVKNSIFTIAVKESGIEDLGQELTGQLAVVTGQQDISSAAKILKNFASEFDRPEIVFGFLDNQKLEKDSVKAIADLPSLEVLRAKLVGVIAAPATKLVQVLNTPATNLARVLQAKADQGE